MEEKTEKAEKAASGAEKKPHSSSKRQRTKGAMVRLTPVESAALHDRARRAGLSTGAYLRACALGDSGPRAKRAPPLNRELLGDALASLNRVGNNLNQIAKHLNTGGHPNHSQIADTRADLVALIEVILEAIGRH